ncbi:hypothetical protein K438DRAFT_2016747 [Mycena galopus ATCC 62051]|nr:hypothetical protein K438DRAFT_2016747 [Mycena galopus ATCC 62051]
MSLLRDVLKKSKDGSSKKRDSASVKSAGARSFASLYSLVIGGERVKKRRKPDFSELGAPVWYHEDPPEPPDMPGTAPTTDMCAYTVAHGTVLPLRIEDRNHWLSLILFNHASESSSTAMYHNEARVAGEVRLCLEKAKSISSVDVWLEVVAPSGQIISLTANVWNRHKGDPRQPGQKLVLFKAKFPEGTYIFPFELPPLPRFVPVTHPDNDTRKTKGLVPLPPGAASGKISYTCGVGVRRDSVGGINEDMDMILQYFPLNRPLPRPRTQFPFLASREDWPFKRETIGGWVLSPFGGRGRIGTQIVEVEGILGVQDPAVCTAGKVVEFGLLLWSKSADALKLLGQPAAVSVGYYKAAFMPSSEALRPREQSRQTRTMTRIAEGQVWLTESGRPVDNGPAPEPLNLGGAAAAPPAKPKPVRGSSLMQSVWTADSGEDAGSELTPTPADGEPESPPSPADSIKDLPADDEMLETEFFQRLDGELRIPPCRPVSYRYTETGVEYSLQLHITHPQYAHISPTGPGLLAEVPLWYVGDRVLKGGSAALNNDPTYLAALPLKGVTLPAGEDAVWWPKALGEVATQARGGKAKIGQSFIGLFPPAREGP